MTRKSIRRRAPSATHQSIAGRAIDEAVEVWRGAPDPEYENEPNRPLALLRAYIWHTEAVVILRQLLFDVFREQDGATPTVQALIESGFFDCIVRLLEQTVTRAEMDSRNEGAREECEFALSHLPLVKCGPHIGDVLDVMQQVGLGVIASLWAATNSVDTATPSLEWRSLIRWQPRDTYPALRDHPVQFFVALRARGGLLEQYDLDALLAEAKRAEHILKRHKPTSKTINEGFQPANWFPKNLRARLRMAASATRRTKRVATRKIDGVVCYSVADARRWWPRDVPK